MIEKSAKPLRDKGKLFSFKKILVPVDFSTCTHSAVAYAVAVGEHFGATLVLLHIVEPGLHSDGGVGLTAINNEINQSLVEAAREKLEQLRDRAVPGHLCTETLVRIGRAYSEIPDTAHALGADLIVVSHRQDGLQHALLGSTAERIVRQAPCPVLAVRSGDEPRFNPGPAS